MIVADTSVWIDYWNGESTSQAALFGKYMLSGEVQPYRRFSGKRLAYQSAENYRLLRKKGITIRKTVDVIIGTFCIENGLPLLHDDRDFDPMEMYLGLKVVRSVEAE
ncbi:ribonuclease VapC [Spirochaetia bacterium]|nr:ribonuclease VapC [Spirochaetia bacterium]